MHVIPHNPEFDTLQRGDKLFLEAWFNLTHTRSLDSFRVRCHNGRTILEELKREAGHSFAGPADIAVIATEAKEICSKDTVLLQLLGPAWPLLSDILGKLMKPKGEKAPEAAQVNAASSDPKPTDETGPDKTRAQLDYVLTDVLPPLPARYLQKILSTLEAAITASDDEAILRLTDCLATELAARGWAVASLHSWVETTFLGASWVSLPFVERFRYFAERMQRSPEEYEVVFSLSGSSELDSLGDFCSVQFSRTPPTVQSEDAIAARGVEKFLRANPQRTFAKTVVLAVDQFSAIHEAEEKLAKCQDRMRFNFISLPVERWRHGALVTRLSDKKSKVVPSLASIPSPEHHLKLGPFLKASEKIDELFNSDQIDDTSRRRIEAAVRHYRLGLDARSYHDMLLNWWMGLETLTNTDGHGRGGIGGKVMDNAVPLLAHRYLHMQLRYLGGVVKSACGEWPVEIAAALGQQPPPYLNSAQLLHVLQTPAAFAAVTAAIVSHPWVELRWKRFQVLANDPNKLSKYLTEHETRVRWHLKRLYRMRCCLVHGTPVVTPLQLPTANLEYYLREAIYVVMIALGRAPQIRSLEGVFDRAHYCASRRHGLLHKGGSAADAVNAAFATEITLQLSK